MLDFIILVCYALVNYFHQSIFLIKTYIMKLSYKNQTFPVIVQEDEAGGYVVINPSLEGCYSQGETIEDALENIKEATELCLEDAG
ncbi:hypothetical protein A2477_03405 [Candidatus Falkowbacteria bacterium RIFOXYC2_FULL_47_12]|uniref:HicB-like antitoxin of toxin-antitoxin system domain-containing protein n=1 Tax=Candidatus Falkowbacteria bacterium RIFOXYC2_FULL_47_12 TaxID=1798004 RepID=A0A1F5TP11_9BACT|nr:MAG: hypothetical protein A2477_03405 [Candidatus Falkowbacteria bacterium RIFOXYC2_FULL_47_12]